MSVPCGERVCWLARFGRACVVCSGAKLCPIYLRLRLRLRLCVLQHEPALGSAASAGDCAPKAAAAPASSAARRPHDATCSVAAAGTVRGCALGVRSAVVLAASSTAIEALRIVE